MLDIKELIKEAHETALLKGWWDEPVTFGDFISNVHAELSEAFEEYRKGESINTIRNICERPCFHLKNGHCCSENPCIPIKSIGIPTELADVLIRIFDFCGKHEIDLEKAIKIKMEYNKTREYRHGGKIV